MFIILVFLHRFVLACVLIAGVHSLPMKMEGDEDNKAEKTANTGRQTITLSIDPVYQRHQFSRPSVVPIIRPVAAATSHHGAPQAYGAVASYSAVGPSYQTPFPSYAGAANAYAGATNPYPTGPQSYSGVQSSYAAMIPYAAPAFSSGAPNACS